MTCRIYPNYNCTNVDFNEYEICLYNFVFDVYGELVWMLNMIEKQDLLAVYRVGVQITYSSKQTVIQVYDW